MADTIAVMNAGPDRAAGRPRRAVREPGAPPSSPTSSASPTCIAGHGRPARTATSVTVDAARPAARAARRRGAAPTERRGASSASARRRCTIAAAEARRSPDGANRLLGGVVTDASFIGVSTQYLVRLPWRPGADGLRAEHRPGRSCGRAPRSSLHWEPGADLRPRRRPGHRRRRGAGRGELPRERRRSQNGARPRAPTPAAARRAHGGAASLALPAAPAARPAVAGRLLRWCRCLTSVVAVGADRHRSTRATSSPGTGRPTRDALADYWPQFVRSLLYAVTAHRAVPGCSATRWRTSSPSRPAGGRTCCWSWSSRRSSPAS